MSPTTVTIRKQMTTNEATAKAGVNFAKVTSTAKHVAQYQLIGDRMLRFLETFTASRWKKCWRKSTKVILGRTSHVKGYGLSAASVGQAFKRRFARLACGSLPAARRRSLKNRRDNCPGVVVGATRPSIFLVATVPPGCFGVGVSKNVRSELLPSDTAPAYTVHRRSGLYSTETKMRGRRTRATSTKTKRTAIYIRCSTDEQVENGVTLAAQEARLRAFALATEREVDEVVIDDGYSAKDLNRPGITRLLDEVRAGNVETVIILKLDRITRSVRDLATLLELFAKANAALVSVGESLDTQTAAGRMVVNMLGVVAQWERETIAERTSFALAHKRANSEKYSGRVPFGYRVEDGRLVEDPATYPALAMISDMYANGEGASLRQIATALAERNIRPPHGSKWHASSVLAVIRSRMFQERMA